MLPAQTFQQDNYLRLDGNVERSRGFIGDDDTRLGTERQSDHDPLTHAAGKFVRIGAQALGRRRYAHLPQQVQRALPRFGRPDRQMGPDRLFDLVADREQRIEAGQRVLENRADLAASNLVHCRRRKIVDPPAFEQDLAGSNSGGRRQKLHHRGTGHRFASTAFADDAQGLAWRELQRNIVERHQRSPSIGELDAHAAELEQGHLYRSRGLRTRRAQSPRRLIASTITTSNAPGKIAIHHSPENRKSLPLRMSVPRDGWVIGMPTPR